jgi:hypothetical protein
VGGVEYLASLADGVPRADNIEYYCRIIKYKARERQAIANLHHGITEIVEGEDELDVIIERVQSRLAKVSETGGKNQAITGLYTTLDDLFNAQIEEPEEIIFGLHRGEVAELSAVTNYGKTTLLYNTALSIAAGQKLEPLVPIVPKPRRVLYLDSESPASRSRADLKTMLKDLSDSKEARANFAIVVDAVLDGTPLNLSNPTHFNWIVALAKELQVDLAVIDTAASAFQLQDENNNAEITRRVMNPLKRLAREADCAVIFTHHIGKANETQTGEAAYKGRGASAFGALSRVVFTLERDTKKGPEYIMLSCAKPKGGSFEPALLKLNRETRWFDLCAEPLQAKSGPPTAQEIADFVAEQVEARTEDISNQFKDRAAHRTIVHRVIEAERLRLIERPNRKAPWRSCNGKNGYLEEVAVTGEITTDMGFVQNAASIRDCTLHEPGSNGSGKGVGPSLAAARPVAAMASGSVAATSAETLSGEPMTASSVIEVYRRDCGRSLAELLMVGRVWCWRCGCCTDSRPESESAHLESRSNQRGPAGQNNMLKLAM